MAKNVYKAPRMKGFRPTVRREVLPQAQPAANQTVPEVPLGVPASRVLCSIGDGVLLARRPIRVIRRSV